ncbi:hypothetical protein ACIG3E_11320 [Streptomyces sp. NPDC053474]|uniref:hypothetical protein n=1 Tax=Streptomyces sp. NPDC053474 TaxID=3365704 RepID=UPI0037D54737
MRWRLNDTRIDAQKEARHIEAGQQTSPIAPEFHWHQHIAGYEPPSFFNTPDIEPDLMEIHPATLSESVQFSGGTVAGRRPSGSFSSSSRNGPSESQPQKAQDMPHGHSGDYYR